MQPTVELALRYQPPDRGVKILSRGELDDDGALLRFSRDDLRDAVGSDARAQQTVELQLEIKLGLTVVATSSMALTKLRQHGYQSDRFSTSTLNVFQCFELAPGTASLRPTRHYRGTNQREPNSVPDLHPLLRLDLSRRDEPRFHLCTEFIDVTEIFRFAARWTTGRFDHDADGDGFSWAALAYTGTDTRVVARRLRRKDVQPDLDHWIWIAAYPRLERHRRSRAEREGKVSALLHYQPFPDFDYRSVLDQIFASDLERGVGSPGTKEETHPLLSRTFSQGANFGKGGVHPVFASLRASYGKRIAERDSPWVLLWPLPKDGVETADGGRRDPDHGPAHAKGAWGRAAAAVLALQGLGQILPTEPRAQIGKLALSAFSGGGFSLVRALLYNRSPGRTEPPVRGLLISDISSFEKSFDKNPAVLERWRPAGGRPGVGFVVWGTNGSWMTKLARAWDPNVGKVSSTGTAKQNSEFRVEFRPSSADFWLPLPKGDRWWNACFERLDERHPKLMSTLRQNGSTRHQFAFIGGEGGNDDATRAPWLKLFLDAMDKLPD